MKTIITTDTLGQKWIADGKWHKALAGFYYKIVPRADTHAFLYVHNDMSHGGTKADGWGFDWGYGLTHGQALANDVDGGSLPNKKLAKIAAENSLARGGEGRLPE